MITALEMSVAIINELTDRLHQKGYRFDTPWTRNKLYNIAPYIMVRHVNKNLRTQIMFYSDHSKLEPIEAFKGREIIKHFYHDPEYLDKLIQDILDYPEATQNNLTQVSDKF